MKSDFDFCQGSIKEIFNDKALASTLAEKYGVLMRYITHLHNCYFLCIVAYFFSEISLMHM